MPASIVRTGRQRAALAAGPSSVADVLSDPVTVTRLLGDLLDQGASDPGPPPRWVIPQVRVGLSSFDTVLAPTFRRSGDDVKIVAPATPDSDVEGRVVLDCTTTPLGPGASRLVTAWRLELDVAVPRTALRLAGPALDRTIKAIVQSIMHRTERAVLDAE